ncbi:MAG: hypothetical protein AMK73_07160 [Planctomycetes bacterium SM23_32]|nr:MAG: hypothetical protein AMK73_07160 [Planctomycetes bacterium SM23_32]
MRVPEQDHYQIARDRALEKLRHGLDEERLGLLGARMGEAAGRLVLPALCWELHVGTEPFSMTLGPEGREVSIVWQILALDYLSAERPAAPAGFLSFADFAQGRGYQPAFDSRVNRRLSSTVGREREQFARAVRRLGAEPGDADPMRCIFRFFPLLEFEVVRYDGDKDFPPSCNVLLPDNLLSLFTMEDGIVAAERLVAALEGKTPAATSPPRSSTPARPPLAWASTAPPPNAATGPASSSPLGSATCWKKACRWTRTPSCSSGRWRPTAS